MCWRYCLFHSESNLTAVSFGDLCDIAEVLWKYALLCLLSISLSVFCLITLVSKIVFLLGGLISIHVTAEWICKLGNVAYISPEVRREWLEYHWLNYQFTLFGNLLLRVIPLHPTSAGPNPNSVLVRLLALHLHILTRPVAKWKNTSTNFNTIQDEKY